MAERLLGATEVSRRVGRSRWTIYRYAELGLIPHTRVGGRIVFPEAALDAWLAQQMIDALAGTVDARSAETRETRQVGS